jgi:WD40-like Beta Propeller Repeat
VRRELERIEIPGEHEARGRALSVVLAGFAAREPVSRRRSRTPVVVVAALLAFAAGLLSPPGRAVLGELREVVGVEQAEPALFSLPASGRVLVVSGASAWIVSPDGSTRLLGPYRDAAWSPFGRFVVGATPLQIAALEPDGEKRWSLARPEVRLPAWGGTRSDTRIAYLTRSRLHVVAGDGTGDVDAGGLPAAAAAVRPAWRPGPGHVLAYADTRGRVAVYDTRGTVQLRTSRVPGIRALAWSRRGTLLVVTGDGLIAYGQQGQRLLRRALPGVRSAEYAPDGRSLAVARGREVLLLDARTLRTSARVFAGRGPFAGASWSPDGRWLLVSWPAADQWVFVQVRGGRRVTAVSNIAAQFEGYPRSVSWCCP